MMKKLLLAASISLLAGCFTPTINVVKPWEGHYYTAEEAKSSLEELQLEEGESVWILSNRTLKRVLKNNTK